MHITVVGVGSRGDVQPFIGLGIGLRAAGHDVRVVAQKDFRDLVERSGLDFAPIHYQPSLQLGT